MIKKAQSAMEYLMTYGWAILIIAVVLSVLFSLGIFNQSNVSGSECIESPGYLCSGAIYQHSDANIVVTIGQSTGINWVGANFVFVPEGTPFNVSGVPMIKFTTSPANTVYSKSQINSGQFVSLTLPANSVPFPVDVGTSITGGIWASYTYYQSNQGITQLEGPKYVQVAAINLKAT